MSRNQLYHSCGSLKFGILILSDKQIDISFFCVCPLIDDKLHHNVVKVAVEPQAADEWFHSGHFDS